jgi:protein-arginine kinase activator protein McsA
MKHDEFLCKECKMKWKQEGMIDPKFCSECYSQDILNLSKEERVRETKNEKESKAREKREHTERMKKKLRHEELKARQRKLRYSRMKKR